MKAFGESLLDRDVSLHAKAVLPEIKWNQIGKFVGLVPWKQSELFWAGGQVPKVA
jgi:hypothetical protein